MGRPRVTAISSKCKKVKRDFYWRSVGPFLVPSDLPTKHQLTFDARVKFWTEENLKRVLLPLLLKESPLSLRNLDWLFIGYSVKHKCCFAYPSPDNADKLMLVDINSKYDSWLTHYGRPRFDVFRRGPYHIYLRIDGKPVYDKKGNELYTTVAQLNLLFMADVFGILDYGLRYNKEISDDMKRISKKRKQEKQQLLESGKTDQLKKRSKLVEPCRQPLTVYHYEVNLDFKL